MPAQITESVSIAIFENLDLFIRFGFDAYAKQTEASDPSSGTHAKLLGKLSVAIDDVMDVIKMLQVDDRVLGMTISEFGRRIKSNASGGADHGAPAPVILFGKCVRPGIAGINPLLPALATDNDDIAMQVDFL